jgi:hypothetical protein
MSKEILDRALKIKAASAINNAVESIAVRLEEGAEHDTAQAMSKEILDRALKIKAATAINKAVESVAIRLAENAEGDTAQARQRLMEERSDVLDALMHDNQQLANQLLDIFRDILDVLEVIREQSAEPTEVSLKMDQQPVTVNVPKSTVSFNPNIDIPVPSVTIEQPKRKIPTEALINHSDGSQSRVEFK